MTILASLSHQVLPVLSPIFRFIFSDVLRVDGTPFSMFSRPLCFVAVESDFDGVGVSDPVCLALFQDTYSVA
jgi:hypothetical protein